ncbi:hypothetical protein LOY38_15205 [Pseudomonas sp. B21-015]|uniref:toxin VasX n=1 Tax=Pseudomonas sp. B21-015 TaxID=2895473 RepID=UPI00215E3014|nr:toxin VasX [Pseudomonas sp. B21-015]UVM47785.1 hypothetical protein LOY38_15205 [Pseudomonas sp. B21-015]
MTQATAAKPDFKPAACPLITAVVPLRYAIGPSRGIDVSAFALPAVSGKFPELGEDNSATRDKALNYTARLLRDGWLYVWQSSPEKLIEFKVDKVLLQETGRGGKVIDTSSKPYLMLPAGTPAMLSWSPSKWSDKQFSTAKAQAKVRTRVMRSFTPGAAPASGKAASIHESIGDYMEPIGFKWSCVPSTKNKPNWSSMLDDMKRCEQQAYVMADDPWGVWLDLAAMIRSQQSVFDQLRKKRSEDWAMAGALKSLADNDAKIKEQLPSITRYKEVKAAWEELDSEETRYNEDRRRLTSIWNDWLKTFQSKGPSTLDTAAGQFDITLPDPRMALEVNFAAACLGPSSCSLSAKALGGALDPDKQEAGQPWLLWVVLGLSKRLAIADIKSIIDLSDGVNDNASGLAKASAKVGRALALASAINKGAEKLATHSPAKVQEALMLALSPVVGAHLQRLASEPDNIAKIYFSAAMGRSQQRLTVGQTNSKQIGEWLSDLMGTNTSPQTKTPTITAPAAVADALPFYALAPLNTAGATNTKLSSIADLVKNESSLNNLLNLSKSALDNAPIKCVVAIVAALNLRSATNDAWNTPSAKTVINSLGGTFGMAAASAAIWQKVAETNWEAAVSASGKESSVARIALADALGLSWKAAGFQTLSAAVDIVAYGLDAFEAYQSGDYDTASINVGLSAASTANIALYVKTFRALRAARAAVIAGDAAAIGRGVTQVPHIAFKALGITILIVGGIVARLYTQDTPLEKWIKGTKFGISPADWSSDYTKSMTEFYKIIFPISLDAYRLSELNPYKGMVESTYVLLRLPGKETLTDGMIKFDGEEVWGGIFGLGGKHEKVSWSGNSFDLHAGTRVTTEAGTGTYRRVYHIDLEGRALNSIKGNLTYSPLDGLSLPPIEIKELAWL